MLFAGAENIDSVYLQKELRWKMRLCAVDRHHLMEEELLMLINKISGSTLPPQ
jgi:hypothetical protein